MSFNSLGLSAPVLAAIESKGYTEPSPIQAKAIPIILSGKDIMAAAQTGTGKTAGFTLPLLELLSDSAIKLGAQGNRAKHGGKGNQVRSLVLTPTRELAAQVAASVETYSQNLNLKSVVVYGGVKINPQMMKLRGGVDILVATPGRLLDLYNQKALKFDQLEVLVLDEADRMLDMGFIHDIKRIVKLLPEKRQNLLFSATFSPSIRDLAKGIVHQPSEISVTPENSTATTIEQCIYTVDKGQKPKVLVQLIKENNWHQVLVFSKTKHGANRLTRTLEANGIDAAAIHGNKSQGARTRALENFKKGDVQVLVATDIAARGIDISQLPQVVNFDLPQVSEDYVHRIGRTGRAGMTGKAISLVCAEEFKLLSDIERLIQKLIDRKVLEGFEPTMPVPESVLNTKPFKPKKPKKPKKEKPELNSSGNEKPSKTNAKINSKPKPKPKSKPKKPNSAKKSDKPVKSDNTGKSTNSGRKRKPNTAPNKPGVRKRPPKSAS